MRILLFVLVLFITKSSLAQSKFSALGAAGYVGTFANHKAGGFTGGMSFFAKYQQHHFELALQSYKGYNPSALPDEEYKVIGALYGRSLLNTRDRLIGFVGLGIVNGTTRGDFWFEKFYPGGFFSDARTVRYYYKETVWLQALMLKVEGRFPLAQIIDFRLAAYANVTYKVPSFGFQLGFGFGKVRERK